MKDEDFKITFKEELIQAETYRGSSNNPIILDIADKVTLNELYQVS